MRVLLIEDDQALSGFHVRLLQEEGYEVSACDCGMRGLAAVAGCDLVILDGMLPDMDGLEVCRTLRQRSGEVPVLMLTARGELADRVTGLETGADDYLVKPFEVEELLARIRALHRRAGAPIGTCGPLRIDWRRRRAIVDSQPLPLTAREFDLLACLMRQRAEVVGKAELLREVWGMERDPGTKIVEVHMSRLRAKLGAAASLLETVRGGGYRLVGGGAVPEPSA